MGHLALFHYFLSRRSGFPYGYPVATTGKARIWGYMEIFFCLLLSIQLVPGSKNKMVKPEKGQPEFPCVSSP